MKIYMAGALFTAAERLWNERIAKRLRELGYQVFLPQEVQETSAFVIFSKDVAGLDDADVVVAWVEGPDPDSGTSWEIGYSYANGKLIIVYTTDSRFSQEDERYDINPMIAKSAHFFLRFDSSSSPEFIADCLNDVITMVASGGKDA